MMHAWPKRCFRITACLALVASMPACTSTAQKSSDPNKETGFERLYHWVKRDPVDEGGPTIATPKDRIIKLQQLAKTAPERGPAQLDGESQDLISVLRKEEDPLIRAEILRTLAVYPTPSASKMLTAGLKDSDSDVRIACCEAWGQRKGHDATRLLSETLSSDADIDVRLAAARALGETGDPAATAALGLALDNADPAMQYRAVQSLKKVTGRNYDDNVAVWKDYLKGNSPPEPSLATRIKNWF